MCTFYSHGLHKDRFGGVICFFDSIMLDSVRVGVAEIIDPQTVVFFIDNFAQFVPYNNKLCVVERTLKHRILHPLTVVDADFCDF